MCVYFPASVFVLCCVHVVRVLCSCCVAVVHIPSTCILLDVLAMCVFYIQIFLVHSYLAHCTVHMYVCKYVISWIDPCRFSTDVLLHTIHTCRYKHSLAEPDSFGSSTLSHEGRWRQQSSLTLRDYPHKPYTVETLYKEHSYAVNFCYSE